MLWLKPLCTVIIVTCLLCFRLIEDHGHLPISLKYSKYIVTLGFNEGCIIVLVQPDLYGDDHGIDVSKVNIDAPFQFSLMMLLYIVWAFWLLQHVLVSGKHSFFLTCLMLLSMILRNVSPSFPKSSPFGFCNNSLVKPLFLFQFYPKKVYCYLRTSIMWG